MSREIMQQALTALNTCNWDYDSEEESYKTFDEDLVNAAAAALKEALAKPDLSIEANRVAYDVAMHYANKTKEKLSEQEPVSTNDHLCAMLRQVHDVLACTALPMKRQWVGLSVEDQADILGRKWWNFEDEFDLEGFLRVTEAKLKEKNNAHT